MRRQRVTTIAGKLALDDPRWRDLKTDGTPIARYLAQLERLARARQFGDFDPLNTIHQGTVCSSTLAIFPRAVEVACDRRGRVGRDD